ncbi:MAG: hypothetical protein Q8M08_12440 [Bacteroidales bacterium]|nr:hypothetical protein [Bacteroidales bacterium]
MSQKTRISNIFSAGMMFPVVGGLIWRVFFLAATLNLVSLTVYSQTVVLPRDAVSKPRTDGVTSFSDFTENPAIAASVTLLPDTIWACVGDTILVPIYVTGDDIGGMELFLDFNHSVLGFVNPMGYANAFPLFSDITYNYDYIPNTTAIISIYDTLWYLGHSHNFTGEKIVDLLFIYNGGTTVIHLRRSPDPDPLNYCALHDALGLDILPVTYTDNQVTGSTLIPAINGDATACAGETKTYSTNPGNANYIWTVSAGGTITAGAGTNEINVTWNTAGAQSVSVNYMVGTETSCTTVLNVTVNSKPTTSSIYHN